MLTYLQHFPRRNNKSFTLVEIMIVTAISTVLFGAIFLALNTGENTNTIGNANLDLQQEVRRVLDWMIRDFRQTRGNIMTATDSAGTVGVIYNNIGSAAGTDQTFSDPIVPLCTGYVIGAGATFDHQVTYAYDAVNQKVTRTFTNLITGEQFQFFFNHISNLVFTRIDDYMMHIDIAGQIIAKRGPAGNQVKNVALAEELKFRN